MRKVIVQEFVSIDGRASGPSGSVDFVPGSTQGDQSFGDRQMAFIDSIDTMLLGRVTYEMFAGYWPNVAEGEDKPFADKLNNLQKVVFTRTLDRAPWGTFGDARIVTSDAALEVETLKQADGKDMVIWGSLSLAQSLMDADLVDEYQLVVCPVVLGDGRALFREKNAHDFELVDTRAFDRGTVLLSYRARS
ncbi:MAG TPA: dihydrofolate reductase family protein [Thermoanaerobaculia bacterium]|jgi:dihydrofolate reductase|nr:dihydrofolate reductase family protein [Thermoanaerobaculia bacterium]